MHNLKTERWEYNKGKKMSLSSSGINQGDTQISPKEDKTVKALSKAKKARPKCPHGRLKYACLECGGKGICEHKKHKYLCAECGGRGICEHRRIKRTCVECKGPGICEHRKRKNLCVECKGKGIYVHRRIRRHCFACSYEKACMRTIEKTAMKSMKGRVERKEVSEIFGCSMVEYRKYMEAKFEEGMTWENHGEWHIDHIIPLQYNNPTEEEVRRRNHYTNTQPMWAWQNVLKGSRYIGKYNPENIGKRRQIKNGETSRKRREYNEKCKKAMSAINDEMEEVLCMHYQPHKYCRRCMQRKDGGKILEKKKKVVDEVMPVQVDI